MTTTSSNKANQAEFNAALDADLRQELAVHGRFAKKQYEEKQAKLVADIGVNPMTAITWDSQAMVATQAKFEVWMMIEKMVASDGPRKAVKHAVEELSYAVRRFFGSNSTCLFTNAVERAKAEAHNSLLETLEGIARHSGIEIER